MVFYKTATFAIEIAYLNDTYFRTILMGYIEPN